MDLYGNTITTKDITNSTYMFLNNKSTVFQFQMVKPTMEELKDIVYNGSSVFANYLFSALRIVVLNMIMNLAGGNSAVTIFAITNHLNECAGCIQNGIPQTGESLMRICKEERDNRALESLLKLQIKTGLMLSAITALVMSLFSNKIGFLFGSSLHVQMAVICWAVSLVVGTFNNVMINYYYAIRQVQVWHGL